jgi:hypothetical protein
MVVVRRFDLGSKPDARPAGAFPSTNPAADRFIGGRTPGVGGTERGSCFMPVLVRQFGGTLADLLASPAKHVSKTNGAPGQSPCAETADQGCRQFEAPPWYQSTRFPLRTRSEIATHPGAHFERTRCGWRFNCPQVGGPLWVSPKSTTRAQAHPRVQQPLSPLSARSSADADNQRMVTVGPLIEPKPCVNVPSPSRGAWACDNKVRRGPRRRHLPLSLRLSPQRRDQ